MAGGEVEFTPEPQLMALIRITDPSLMGGEGNSPRSHGGAEENR